MDQGLWLVTGVTVVRLGPTYVYCDSCLARALPRLMPR